jgi:hypothetical protein
VSAGGIRSERIDFADPKARVTRRLRQQIGLDCQSWATPPLSTPCRTRSAICGRTSIRARLNAATEL